MLGRQPRCGGQPLALYSVQRMHATGPPGLKHSVPIRSHGRLARCITEGVIFGPQEFVQSRGTLTRAQSNRTPQGLQRIDRARPASSEPEVNGRATADRQSTLDNASAVIVEALTTAAIATSRLRHPAPDAFRFTASPIAGGNASRRLRQSPARRRDGPPRLRASGHAQGRARRSGHC
jgi:hypothetical protein